MSGIQTIAERNLCFSLKGKHERKTFAVRVSAPRLVDDSANFSFDDGAAVCTIEFNGLNESSFEVHGIDSIHALALAVDIDTHLKGMSKKYDFYWLTGEPYFDE